MTRFISNEQLSDSFSSKESEKIYPYCISLVTSSLKELENDWNKKIKNNKTKKGIITSLFSLLNFQILLIQQISKYYNLYMYNFDEDNIKLITQIVNINKDLMNKKINAILNLILFPKEKNEKINEEKILNYKISKFNENNKNEIKNNNQSNSYKKAKIKINRTKKKEFNTNLEFVDNNKNKIIKIKKNNNKEDNNSILSNVNTNLYTERNNNNHSKLKLNDILISTNNISSKRKNRNMQELLKRSKTERNDKYVGTPYCQKVIFESPKNNKIKINLADKFTKNNDNTEFATLSNLRRNSKKSIYNNLCLTQSTFNLKKNENTFTIPVEENPFRKVKNIILNAKNSLLFIKTNCTPTNMTIFNKQRNTTYENNNKRKYILSEENLRGFSCKDINSILKKSKSKIFPCSSSKNFNSSSSNNNNLNNQNKEMIKSMSDNKFLKVEKDNKNKENQKNNNIKKTVTINKESPSHQILKDGMKKMEKRLNSKDCKKGIYKTKSKDYLSLIKKITNKKYFK